MLALRLARGARPTVQVRRLLVTAASTGTGFLLLCTLGYALGHPEAGAGPVLRLMWCLAPAAATVYLAVAVARTDPATRPRSGLSAVGLGPVQLTVLSAVSTAVTCAVGSAIALVLFFHLRGGLTELPFDGAAAELLAADRPVPLAAALTLLAIVPLASSAAGALVLRPRRTRPRTDDADPDRPETPPDDPAGLPWGVALLAAGLAVETYAGRSDRAPGLPLPGGLAGDSLGVLAGWALTAVGLALAGPALTYYCGRALQSVRPGAVRLLAGRVLQREARRVGRPLGVVCAVVSGVFAAATLYGGGVGAAAGPLSAFGGLLIVGCTGAALVMATIEAKQARARTTATLLRLGAPAAVLRGAAALRAAAVLAVFGPLTWLIATLAAAPLTP